MARILRNGHGLGWKSKRFKKFVANLENEGVSRKDIYHAVVAEVNISKKTISAENVRFSLGLNK